MNLKKTDCKIEIEDVALSHPEMKNVIEVYLQARSTSDPLLEQQAESLLDELLANISGTIPLCLENGLLGIGCGLICLLRNGWVDGDEDTVLAEVDQLLLRAMIQLEDETTVDWYGWLHYSRLRIICDRSPDQLRQETLLRENTIYLLGCLERRVRKGMKGSSQLFSEIQAFHQMELCPVITEKIGTLFTSMENDRVTFVIPVRIDSPERERNLDLVLDILAPIEKADILIAEGDSRPCYQLKKKYPNVTHHFISDNDPIFHRTKYINWLLKRATGSVVGIWDTDVMILKEQILKAIQAIQRGMAVMCFPYDGRFYLLSPDKSDLFAEKRSFDQLIQHYETFPLGYGAHSVGGAFLVNKLIYLRNGGENEHFYGWGQEDAERVKRMEILNLPVSRIEGPLFHLYHPRKENSWFADEETEIRNRQEFLTVCSMTREKLLAYIQSWEESGCLENRHENDMVSRKQRKEAAFWKAEIERYYLWYTGELPYLYNTPAPLPEEKVVSDNPIHASILTWTELHQKPKYLHELKADSRQFVGKRVLDIGAGPIPSATCFEDCDLYVLDPLMSVYHKLGFPHELYPNVHFVEALAERIPFEDNFFDVILSVNAIDHVDHLEQVAKELQRVAKSDSLFLMHVEYHKATICEPVEMNDDLFENLFAWVRKLRIMSRSTCSFSSVVDKHGQYVLWGNL